MLYQQRVVPSACGTESCVRACQQLISNLYEQPGVAAHYAGTFINANDFEVVVPPGFVDLGIPTVKKSSFQPGGVRPLRVEQDRFLRRIGLANAALHWLSWPANSFTLSSTASSWSLDSRVAEAALQ